MGQRSSGDREEQALPESVYRWKPEEASASDFPLRSLRLFCCKVVSFLFLSFDSSLRTSSPLQGPWLVSVLLPTTELPGPRGESSLHCDVVIWVVSPNQSQLWVLTYRLPGTYWGDQFWRQPCSLPLVWKLPPSIGRFSTSLARPESVVSSWGKYEEKLMINRQV